MQKDFVFKWGKKIVLLSVMKTRKIFKSALVSNLYRNKLISEIYGNSFGKYEHICTFISPEIINKHRFSNNLRGDRSAGLSRLTKELLL